jgi:5-methylcytosine-specific restriction endonuclease McrA
MDWKIYEDASRKCIIKNPELRSWSAESMAIYVRDGSQCAYCNFELWDSFMLGYYFATLDHILPKSKFGMFESLSWNKTPCCRGCNALKRSYNPDEGENQIDLNNPYFIPTMELRQKWIERSRRYIQERKARREEQFEAEVKLMRGLRIE